MKSSIRTQIFVLVILVNISFGSMARSAVIVSHTGNADPTGENFGAFQTFGGVEGIDQTHGSSVGNDAWNINTTPGTDNHYGFYERAHSPAELADLSDPANAVVFTTTFKILVDETRDANGSFAVGAAFSIGSIATNVNNEWLFLMGLNSTDDLIIRPFGGSPMTFANGLGTFHTLRLEDLDADDVNIGLTGLQRDFDVYVDNVFQFTSVGAGGTASRLFFGEASGSEAQATSVDWSSFRLETIPVHEPSAAILFGLGTVGTCRLARRKRVSGS